MTTVAVQEVTADAMVHAPKVHGRALAVGEVRSAFADDHVHMLLLVEAGQLLGTMIRDDVPEEAERLEPALRFASTTGRTVGPDAPLDGVLATMLATGVRRLAVVDEGGALLGLLCLKRHLGGFCSDTDVGAGTLSAAEAGSVRAVDIPELIEEQRPEAASEGVEMDLEEDPDDASSAEELFRLSAR